jgi:hypothetical protein
VVALAACGSSSPTANGGVGWAGLASTPYQWPTAGVALTTVTSTAAEAAIRPTDTSCGGSTARPEIVLVAVAHTETSSPAVGQRVWLLVCANSDTSSPPGAELVTLLDAGTGGYVVSFGARYTPDDAGSCCPWTVDPPAGARPHTSLERVLTHTEGSDGGFRPNVIAASGLFNGSAPDGQTADGYVPPYKAVTGVPAWLIAESLVLIAPSCPGSATTKGVSRCGRVIGWRQRVIADSDERPLSSDEWSSGPPPLVP